MGCIFISYVREDLEAAERLYTGIRSMGASPWMDKHDLLAGDGWRGAVKQAIRRSSHFVPLISKSSVRKRGFAQREMREAIEVLKEIPPDEIFVIPARLDDSVPPYEELQDLNWLDLFPSFRDGMTKLRRSLAASGGFDSKRPRADSAKAKDANRIRAYRQLFDRPAFRLPCIFEFALVEVESAVQDISAAMATGSVYSRNGNLLTTVPPRGEFETMEFRRGLGRIGDLLGVLRSTVSGLAGLIRGAEGITNEQFHERFYSMESFLRRLAGHVPHIVVQEAIGLMDRIDAERNAILKELNQLLRAARLQMLPYITLSSHQLALSADLGVCPCNHRQVSVAAGKIGTSYQFWAE